MTPQTISNAGFTANDPQKITPNEWKEILACTDVREGWGLDDNCTAEELQFLVYGVKFNFVSGSPGYVGDLFILQGDALEEPMRLIRTIGGLVQSL